VTTALSTLTLPFTKITGSIANAQVPQSAVTQYQGNLVINGSQIVGALDISVSSGIAATVTGAPGSNVMLLNSTSGSAYAIGDFRINRSATTANQVGLGASVQLEDVGARTATILQHSGGQSELWQNNGGWRQVLYFDTSGNSHFLSTINAPTINTTSDARLKKNVRPIDAPLERLARMRGVLFDWKKDGTAAAGVIAQEVQDALSVGVRGDSILRVDPVAIIGLLVESLNAERAAREALEKRVAGIEAA
jgi:hypothetical protein